MPDVTITVNGQRETRAVETRTLLVHFLREQLRLTGTHVGCDTSQCGACVVHLDGRSVKSCTILAVQADGAEVTTIEGIGTASDAGSIPRTSWAAVRLLYTRHDHAGNRSRRS